MDKKVDELDLLANASREQLLSRLMEAELALDAIRRGEVDAFIISGPKGEQVYTLKDAEHPYRVIVEEMNEGAITLDDGTILYSNQCFARMLHLPLEAMAGASILDYLKPNERSRFQALLKEAKAGKAWREEFTLVAGQSPAVYVQIAVSRMQFDGFDGFCVIVSDLTHVKRQENALAKWAKIFEHAQWGIAICSPDGHNFDMVNPAFVRMYGYTFKELLEKPVPNLLSPESRKDFEENLRLAQDRGRHIFEALHYHKDGSAFPVQVDLSAIKDNNEKVVYFVMNVQDITDRKRTEILKKEMQEREKTLVTLQQSNKNLEQFAYMAAHDLQSPLKTIKILSQLLQKKYPNAQAERFIGEIINSIENLEGLTTSLLDYAKVQTGTREFKKIDCKTIIATVQASLDSEIKESNAEIIVEDSVGTVTGDPVLLVQLFQNLISNAIKFRSQEPPQIHIACEFDGKECTFSVRDNGVGLKPEESGNIFEIFRRVRSDKDGVGIGLATCKKIVEIHGGKIWVESQVGKGATFYFTIPG